jgi:hypothetical protein
MTSSGYPHLHGRDVGFELPLVTRQRCVLHRELIDAVTGLMKFTLSSLADPLGGFDGGSQFIDLSMEDIGTALSHSELFTDFITLALLIFNSSLEFLRIRRLLQIVKVKAMKISSIFSSENEGR